MSVIGDDMAEIARLKAMRLETYRALWAVGMVGVATGSRRTLTQFDDLTVLLARCDARLKDLGVDDV